MDFLLWVRGPGFDLALSIFIIGVILRLMEIFSLGRKKDLAAPRKQRNGSGLRTVFSRSLNVDALNRRTIVTIVGGYIFHIGLFIAILLFVPHIQLIESVIGFGWPGLSSSVVDFVAAITIITLLIVLADRIYNPVKRQLTTIGDYWGWLLTFLPMLTGYMAFHHILLPYEQMLALHILSAELLLIFLPFTKLSHAFTLFIARWYNGDISAKRGIAS